LTDFWKHTQTQNLMKIHSLGAESFHVDRQTWC